MAIRSRWQAEHIREAGVSPVVTISKSINLSGSWDSGFAGQNGASIIDGQNARRTVSITSSSAIDQFVIQRSNGSGINIFATGSLTLSNATISGNRASEAGGGIYLYGGGCQRRYYPEFHDCQ